MHFNLLQHPRKNLRLRRFNYKSAGYYFVTFCTEGRLCLFGEIMEKKLYLNEAGHMVYRSINSIKNRYFGIEIDTFIIMPNHVHAIVVINRKGRTRRSAPTDISLSNVVKNIKTYTTLCYMQGVYHKNWQPFHKRLWQRSYYEQIIRNDKSLSNIRQYIIENPLKWEMDKENSDYVLK